MTPNATVSGSADLPGCDEWHPAIRRIYEYWISIHPPQGLPGRQQFDPTAVADQLPWIWMLDVHRSPLRFRYRLVGTEVVESHRRDLTGLWIDEAHPQLRDDPVFLDRYHQVVSTGEPSWRRGRPRMNLDHDYRVVENILLPLAADGRTVDMILCLSRFRLIDDEEPYVVGLPRFELLNQTDG